MKYMLIMNTPRDGYERYMKWPKEIIEANSAFMIAFSRKLQAAGELVASQGLASPQVAKRVRAGKDGVPITDGIFPESKEYLAGFWMIDVDGPERAYALAAEVSTAPGGPVVGADGAPADHFWIEVREVLSGRDCIE